MKNLLFLFLISSCFVGGPLFICPGDLWGEELEVAVGQEDDEQDREENKHAVDKINEVVKNIYQRILALKDKYHELSGFDEKCLVLNAAGFLTLEYRIEIPSSRGETVPYSFKLDLEPLEAKTYVGFEGYFNYELPFLDLQFSGYSIKHPIRRQFDIETALEEYAEELADFQQQYMPLRLMILSERETFRVNEPITFKVVLINTSEHNILVKSLGKESLFFTLNRNHWGTEAGEIETLSPREQRRLDRVKRAEMRALMRKRKLEAKTGTTTIQGKKTHVGDQIILRMGEALSIEFTGEGYRRAQDVHIRGIYQLNVKGLRPTGKITLKIVNE